MSRRFHTAEAAERHLLSFVNYEVRTRYRQEERTHGLRQFRKRLLAAGWDPHAVPTVHVGGTNAKGSVSWLLERILRAGGLRTGLYTSPHLQSMRERIRLEGRPISREAFRAGVERLDAIFGSKSGAGFRTTFEYLTALALLQFQEAGVERAVIEVGLGGRMDSTNVIPAGPVVLTPVSVDHTRVLGRTVGGIAADKAHIIKRGGAAFVMPQSTQAWEAIANRARSVRVTPVRPVERVQVEHAGIHPDGSTFRVRGETDYGRIRTRLLGTHAGVNLATVVAVAESLLPPSVLRPAVRRGLAGVRVPGRLEVRRLGETWVILDGGHNPAAGRAVARALREHFDGLRLVGVVGMARDKRQGAFLRPLLPLMEQIVTCCADNPRAASLEQLGEAIAGLGRTATPGGTVTQAMERALALKPEALLIAGSFLVVGEARRALGLRAP